jgi:4,5-dihydroxyphthalate decarboxylase
VVSRIDEEGGAGRLVLSAALSESPRTRPLIEGVVAPQGVRLVPTVLHGSEMFWRQLKYADFDLSEMSISSLLISTARGDRTWAALPVYTMRKFFHTGILVREGAGIETPADLVGKRVGVPEYQQTSAIWSRGILQDAFSVSPTGIEWFMERGPDRSHGEATGFKPPRGVRLNQIPSTTDIGAMLLDGSLDATLLYLNEKNLVDRASADLTGSSRVRPLFADPAAEGRRYFKETGLFPINHVVVVRRTLLEQHPWLALNLFTAFVEAKAVVRRYADGMLAPYFDAGLLGDDARKALQADPLGYGLKSARRELETVARYVHEQALTPRQVALEEIFAPSTLEL